MKKIILTLITILMLATQSKAVTLKIIQKEGTVTMTRPSGSEVRLKDSTNQIRWWKVKSGGIEIIDNTFIMPENNVEIEPQYTGYAITVKQTENGTISPGTVGVEDNSSQTFTITPDPGYEILDVIIDGTTNLGKISEYEFSEINSNHIITANYVEREKKKLTIEQQNGTIIQEEIAMGKIITLTAEDNEIFTKWESNDIEISNPTNRTINFAMPEKDARIVAKGGKAINKLTISEDGINKIEETKTIGEEITLTADTSGNYFLYWRTNGIEIENKTDSTISFTMPPNDVTVVAVYKDRKISELIVEQPTGVTTTRMVIAGSTVNLTAETQEIFTGWESNDIEISNPTNKTINFTMPDKKVTIIAKSGKTNNQLTYSQDGINKTTETKTAGNTITLTADTYGDYFLYWRTNGIEIENKTDPTISFTMPPNDVTAIPVYKDRRQVELTVGIDDGETNPHFTRKELYGKEITITAPEQEGATFVKWEIIGIEISEETQQQKTITFRMPTTKVRATAIYEKTSEEE